MPLSPRFLEVSNIVFGDLVVVRGRPLFAKAKNLGSTRVA